MPRGAAMDRRRAVYGAWVRLRRDRRAMVCLAILLAETLLVVLLPPLRTVFSVVPLNPLEWLTVLALSLLPTGVCEAVKRRAKSRREQGRRLVRHQPRRFAP